MALVPEPEYHVIIKNGVDPNSGSAALLITIQTVREFTSFGYSIDLKRTTAPSPDTFSYAIGGISLPTVGRPQPGPARAQIQEMMPDTRTITVEVHRKKQVARCILSVLDGAVRSIGEIEEGGLATFEIQTP